MKPITAKALHQTLKNIKVGSHDCRFTLDRCTELAPIINQINTLKKEKNALILAHSYISPEIIHGVADAVGDSYELSKIARDTNADIIVFCAVKFMAETAKLLSPEKTVLIPSTFNGCSLADSITADTVRSLRKKYPDHAFVCYINTTADVKALCDVCVTSSNVVDIVATLPQDKIYFLPDHLMGKNLQNELKKRRISKTVELYHGTCYVHEEYDPDMITHLRHEYDDVQVLSHPECSPTIVDHSDFVGSTSQMVQHVENTDHQHYVLLTECGLSSRIQLKSPQKNIIGSCTMCKYMKSNTLSDIKRVLETPNPDDIITLDPNVIQKAHDCIDQMFYYVTLSKKEATHA